MKEFAKIDVGLREHPKVLHAGDEAGWLFVCAILWSKEHDTDGLIPEYVVPRLTGLKKPWDAMAQLDTAGLIEAVEGGWMLHDYLDHQESSDERRAKRHAASVAGRIGAAKRWNSSSDSEPYGGRNGGPIAEEEEEEEEEEDVPLSERADVSRLVALLAELMLANNPKAKVSPQSKGWKDPVRLLLDRDGHAEADIEQVVRWCQADEFWRSNILSPSKLRKQFETLWLRMQAGRGRSGATTEQAARQSRRLASIERLTTGGTQ